MKLLLIALTLGAAAGLSTSSSAFVAEFGDKHDAGAVMSQLTGMMGAAQQKLSVAERHHKKVVNKVRKQAETMLLDESNAYGKYLGDYTAELSKATDQLESAVQLAKAGLAKAEAAPSSPNDWKDPGVEQRAKLGAQVASAERTVKKALRRQSRQVREAEERGEETMEDEAQKLGLKLGDMTPLVDKAKQTLEAVAEKAPVAVKTAVKADTKKVDIKALQDNLAKVSKKVQADTAALNKKLDGFLTKTGKDVADKTAKLKDDLEVAQKLEIEKVLGRKQAPPAVVKKAAPTKKVAAKKVVAKKVETPVVKAAAAKVAPVVKAAAAKVAPVVKAAAAKVTVAKK